MKPHEETQRVALAIVAASEREPTTPTLGTPAMYLPDITSLSQAWDW